MRQSPDAAIARKDFASSAGASVTSHAPPPGNDVMYLSDAYYNSHHQLYGGRAAPPPQPGFGMHEKLLGGGSASGSVFQHGGFGGGDPGSPMGYAGVQYKPAPSSLHNGLRPHHDATATAALTHRPPSAASVSLPAAPGGGTGLVDEKSPAALSPPLSSSPGSSPPLAESEPGAATAAPDAGDAAVTATDDSNTGSQQQSPTEPLIYPWMRRVHSGHGGKTNHNLYIQTTHSLDTKKHDRRTSSVNCRGYDISCPEKYV